MDLVPLVCEDESTPTLRRVLFSKCRMLQCFRCTLMDKIRTSKIDDELMYLTFLHICLASCMSMLSASQMQNTTVSQCYMIWVVIEHA